ncbi:hypothetical protein ACQY1Q_16100 [Tenacibaculum sp. TC6]|uniref:hypothetical protein n=1 Tax=Tenacibaculum sp. TC6 TaxID=3423223 RepID=UPI003D36881A
MSIKLKSFVLGNKEETKKELKVSIRTTGSILVALSGLILFTDKVANFQLDNNFGFPDTETFLWVLCQSLSPILILIASLFNPYKTSYTIPVYIYSVQMYWIFQPNVTFDNIYLQAYAIGACIGYLLLAFLIFKINSIKKKQELEMLRFQKEANETIELLKKEILSEIN